jgi:hypothetical protein
MLVYCFFFLNGEKKYNGVFITFLFDTGGKGRVQLFNLNKTEYI